MTDEERERWWNEIRDPPMHYSRDGRAISLGEWSQLFEDREYQVIAQDLVADRWFISTVWLGIDHGFGYLFPGRPHLPIIFETMVFDQRGSGQNPDLEQCRYSTEDQARLGHAEMVQLVATLENVHIPGEGASPPASS